MATTYHGRSSTLPSRPSSLRTPATISRPSSSSLSTPSAAAVASSSTPAPAPAPAPISTSTTNPLTKLPTARLTGHRAPVRSLAWNADGRRLASGSVDKALRVWVPEKDLKTSVEYRGHAGEVSCVRWEPTHPERLATCSGTKDDKQLHFWDMRQDKPTHSVDTDGSTIHLTWSPDGETIILSSRYDVVTWIDVKEHKVIKKKAMPTETNEPIFSHNGKILMTAIEGNLSIADFPSENEIHSVRISPAMTTVLDLDPRGRYVAAGSNDNIVSIWETQEFCCVSTMGAHEDPIRACRFSHDGQYLATSAAASGSDDKIIISQIPSLQRAHVIPTNQAVEALTWHPSRTIMAYAAGEQGAIRIFGV